MSFIPDQKRQAQEAIFTQKSKGILDLPLVFNNNNNNNNNNALQSTSQKQTKYVK